MIVEKRGKWLVYDTNGNYAKYHTKEEAEKAAGTKVLEQMYEYAGDTDGSEEEKDVEETDGKAHYDWLKEESDEEGSKAD